MDNPGYVWHMIMQARKGMAQRNTLPHPTPGPMYGAVDYGPGHRCNCHKQHPKPPCPYDKLPKVPTVKKTDSVKVVELRDAFNNLRYKVVMSSIDVAPDPKYGKLYEIEVVNCFSAPDPLVIVHRPEPEEAAINTAADAKKLFDSYVLAYENLIKAETKDFQDISTYKEGIGYELTKPACCATCKWSRLALTENDYIYGVSGRIECTNPENCLDYDFNVEQSCKHHGDGTYHKPDAACKLVIYPNVHAFGKCKNYVEGWKDPYKPVAGDSIADIVDRRTAAAYGSMCEDVASTVQEGIGAQIDEAIDDVAGTIQQNVQDAVQDSIINEVGERIDERLNSGNIVVDGNSGLNDYNGDGTVDENDVIIGGEGA